MHPAPPGSLTRILQLSPSASFKTRVQVSTETGRGQAIPTLYLETFSNTRDWFGPPATLAVWVLAMALKLFREFLAFLPSPLK